MMPRLKRVVKIRVFGSLIRKEEHLNKGKYSPKTENRKFAFNVVPQIDVFSEGGYTKEELKVINESRKILNLPDLKITCTAARVPVFIGHSESVNVELEKKVTREDSKRSIRLLKHCLMQVGIDPETGQIDIDRISTGISSSQRSRIVALREIIFSLDKKLGKDIPIEEIIAEAAEKGIDEVHVQEAIEKLKREGEIFEPKSGHISKM